MGGSSSRAFEADAASGAAAPSNGAAAPAGPQQRASYVSVRSDPIPGDTGVRVVCPRCRAVLMPPATLFRCPCGQLMTFNQQGGTALNMLMAGGAGMPGVGGMRMMTAGDALEARINMLLSRLPPDDPHAMFLRTLLRRLPRRPDGSINIDGVDAVARQLDAELRGAPQALIDLMPTRVFSAAAVPASMARVEEHMQCLVCLEEYKDGSELRTLPCLHSFHKDCIDTWLRGNRSCPMCKTPIDIDTDAALARALEREETGKGAGAAGAP